ncbi:beta-glycosidase [Maribellus sp. CM-23]|uniref:glycoside hydrolase family 30 protein n=1 Tax=Maribellus sp. CM-23 TaxID=2781026 RepID=UPI001F2BCC4C|nr:glycoside hydrolase family 30 beta sandwich domain-containing protein [Maribellus sp. CM-23]MCE4566624.1 beta-glycosidase [Maribellus sp. CM-23]
MKKRTASLLFIIKVFTTTVSAQQVDWTASTEGKVWEQSKTKLEKSARIDPVLKIEGDENIVTFKAWGTCFNERGWDALNMLPRKEQENILSDLFSPEGDLRFTMGRFSMNGNDYARDWYSCDEISGDFELKYFNIDRDKTTLIPFIKAAQHYNPDLSFWISPWSPPSWMKINHYYSVVSNAEHNKLDPKLDYLLFEDIEKTYDGLFPGKLAVNDYFIQDPRYLETYANYFCKFISAYDKEGIPINMVMFQNEPWSYTPYPGCAWTPEGIIRFNAEYLAPALKEQHPEVDLYFGTINTNHYEVIDEVLSAPRMPETFKGVGFQWEGGQILPRLREKYPNYKYVQTESECGWGAFDWGAAEHTFNLINHYLGNGCEEYTFWNAILADDGVSGWGWKQNALIRVDSKAKTTTYTPEYFAVKHYTHYLAPDSKVVAFKNGKEDKLPVMVVKNPEGQYVVFTGNFSDENKEVTVKLGKQFLNVSLRPHSLNTFQIK